MRNRNDGGYSGSTTEYHQASRSGKHSIGRNQNDNFTSKQQLQKPECKEYIQYFTRFVKHYLRRYGEPGISPTDSFG